MNCIILDSSFFFFLFYYYYYIFLQYSRSFRSVPLFIYRIHYVRSYFCPVLAIISLFIILPEDQSWVCHLQLLYFTSKKSNSLHTRLVLFFFQGFILL